MTTEVAKRNARNRRAGKDWERTIRDGLRELGLDVETLRQTGTKDEGDLVVRFDGRHVVIEAKNAAFTPGPFVDEAQLEAQHYAFNRKLKPVDATGIVIVKRRQKSLRQAFVLTTVEDYFNLPAPF